MTMLLALTLQCAPLADLPAPSEGARYHYEIESANGVSPMVEILDQVAGARVQLRQLYGVEGLPEEEWAELSLQTVAGGMIPIAQRSPNGRLIETPVAASDVERLRALAPGESLRIIQRTPQGEDIIDIQFVECTGGEGETASLYALEGTRSGERRVHIGQRDGWWLRMDADTGVVRRVE